MDLKPNKIAVININTPPIRLTQIAEFFLINETM